MPRSLVTCFVLASILLPVSSSQAQLAQSFDSPTRTFQYELTVSPASPQPPVLQHRLLPQRSELVKGNAAMLYHRAFSALNQTVEASGGPRQFWDQFEDWSSLPLEELPLERMERDLAPFDQLLQEVQFGARRNYCDWGLSIRENPRDVYSRFAPIERLRLLNSLLSHRVRLRLAQGRLNDALIDLQTIFSLSRHIGDSQLMIGGMIGTSLCSGATVYLFEAVAQEEMPNLYWPITNLPSPIVDPHISLQLEADLAFLMVPELALARTHEGDEAFWNQTLFDLLERWHFTDSIWHFSFENQPRNWVGEPLERAVISAYIFSHVPAVRQILVEQMGYDAAEVERMPGSRVLLLHAGLHLDNYRDETSGLFGLPYPEALRRQKQLDHRRMDDRSDPLNIVNLLHYPITGQYLNYLANVERRVALLRTVEALRDQVATHGVPPESLDEVTRLAVPTDPITGQSFLYHRDKTNPRRCTLETEGDLAEYQVRIEITFRE